MHGGLRSWLFADAGFQEDVTADRTSLLDMCVSCACHDPDGGEDGTCLMGCHRDAACVTAVMHAAASMELVR